MMLINAINKVGVKGLSGFFKYYFSGQCEGSRKSEAVTTCGSSFEVLIQVLINVWICDFKNDNLQL